MAEQNLHAQKITTHLWFDKQAAEAAELYVSVFGDGQVKNRNILRDTPSGDTEILTIELFGQEFTLISAGPLFKFNPSISFLVACRSREEVDRYWNGLAEGGTAYMELGEYPFSERYGWLQDRYGLSWQFMYMSDRDVKQRITPTLMFVGEVLGKAEEAVNFYVSVFPDSGIDHIMPYGEGEEPDTAGTVRHAGFSLAGVQLAAMDSARMHDFSFNEAISLMVHCRDQQEIDYYWEKLSAVPEAEQCGWLKDRYGVSWQVVPDVMDTMMRDGDAEQIARVTQAFLKMKKFDIAALVEAYRAAA